MTGQRRGALLLEMIFALAIFVVAATTIILIMRSGVAEIRRAMDAHRAVDHAASAIAQIEAGLRTAQDLAGPVARYSAEEDTAGFDNAPPEPSNWLLEIETTRSDIVGLLVLIVTARYDDAPFGTMLQTGTTEPAGGASATLTALVPLDRAEPPEENPDDELQALFDEEAIQ